ncbi:MAG: glycosyltransferase [Thermoanaerobaculia bacterium]|nr:glycosyltransferase [Thermoanaerobaculia bacterium]
MAVASEEILGSRRPRVGICAGGEGRVLRVGFVWTGATAATHLSFRFELYVAGMERLGHEGLVVCAPHDGLAPVHYRLEVADSEASLRSADFWRGLGLDVAVVISWHRRVGVLAALREAGVRTVAIADTDGQMGLRTYPLRTLEEMLVYRQGWWSRLGCLKYWLGRYLGDGLRGSREDEEFVESTRLSDAVVFTTEASVAAFTHFLQSRGREELIERLHAVPYAVPDACCEGAVAVERTDRMLAAARWEDEQKNPGLMLGALDHFLRRRPSTEVFVYGAGGELFSALAGRYASLVVKGVRPLAELTAVLETSRAMVFSSRWESGPHAAMEALASGASVVGPRIPSLAGFTQEGRFGTLSRPRPRALAQAMIDEMESWDSGRRDALQIAAYWRPRLSAEGVCRGLLATLDS